MKKLLLFFIFTSIIFSHEIEIIDSLSGQRTDGSRMFDLYYYSPNEASFDSFKISPLILTDCGDTLCRIKYLDDNDTGFVENGNMRRVTWTFLESCEILKNPRPIDVKLDIQVKSEYEDRIDVYVVNDISDKIIKFNNMNTDNWEEFGESGNCPGCFNSPQGIFVDENETIYISDERNSRIVIMSDMNGSDLRYFDDSHSLRIPIQFIKHKDHYYLIDRRLRRVSMYDDLNGNNAKHIYSTRDGIFVDPFDIDVDSRDFIYILDRLQNCVYRFDFFSRESHYVKFDGSSIGVKFRKPWGIHIDSKDRLYISDTENHRIIRVDDIFGNGYTEFGTWGKGTNQMIEPHDIATDKLGRIYITDSVNHRIIRINDMNGSGWDTFGSHGLSKGKFVTPTGIFVRSK